MARHRVLVGCLALEANTFAPGETTLEDFNAQIFAVGSHIHRYVLGPTSELAAAWGVLETAECEIVPSVVAWSSPQPPIELDALQKIVRLALSACDDAIDGVYLMLHGSAACHGDDDPEGTLLAALRDRLGAGRPIVVSLDCHANLTPLMLDSVDAITAYRTCPHTDVARTGSQAARILVEALRGSIHPVCAMAGRPMITPADLHDSSRDPFRRLMSLCDVAEQREGALAAALLPVQPWLDLPGLGWKAVVTTDGDRDAARDTAERIAETAWRERRAFLGGHRLTVDEALDEALGGPAPFVVADAGDSPSGGSPGDSTELLRAALRRASGRILLSVLDPSAAEAAHRAGDGKAIKIGLGSGPSGSYNERVSVTARVARLFDGEFRYTHPFASGYRATSGPAALLEVDTVQIVVHSRRVMLLDPALYYAVGTDPAAAAVVQAKSHVSYRAGFAPLTSRSVVADTDGPTTANLEHLPYRRRPRPLFPFEE